MPHQTDYWSISIGIQHYPAFQDDPAEQLQGPENDARDFHTWVTEPSGGQVPPQQSQLIVSSNYPPAATPGDAEPSTAQVHASFEKLQDIAEANSAAGNGFQVGRRLYIYMAGHGFSPRNDQTALFTAHATRMRPHHVLGTWVADWFFRAGHFDEILLFMDCCREEVRIPSLFMPWVELTADDAPDRVRRFYAYGAKWSRRARERDIGGTVRGVFSVALMAGLRGAAEDVQNPGTVTARSLGDYIFANLQGFLAPEERSNPETQQLPEISSFRYATPFVICTVTPPLFPVVIELPGAAAGKPLRILSDQGFKEKVSTVAQPPRWSGSLPRGTYLALLEGKQTIIEVAGTGEVHANFA